MNNTLELRSTFRLSDAMTEIPTISINKPTPLTRKHTQKVDSTSEDSYKKNKMAAATHMVQMIRRGMDQEMKLILEPYITKNLASIIRSTFSEGNILRVNSDIAGFELGHTKEVCNQFRTKCFIRKGIHKGDVILDLPGFVPSKELSPPTEATNFKISTKLVAVSRLEKDEANDEYKPLAVNIDGLTGGYETSMLPLIKIQTQPITARLYINELKNVNDEVDTVMLTAVKYYKYSNGKFEHLSKSGCMSITRVF